MNKNFFEKDRKLIEKALDSYLPNKKVNPRIIHEAMRYSVMSGGKRIRPILLLESARTECANINEVIPLACAVELIHAYSLIHDDLPSMDDDDKRRGKPSCHIKYGEAIAILAGDALLTLAFNVASRIRNKSRLGAIISELTRAIGTFGMIGGQVMDLTVKENDKISPPVMEYINIHKTGSLIAASAKIGAIACGASPKRIDAIAKYGEYIGTAFQIIDDILDDEGYAKIVGVKSAKEEAALLTKKAKAALMIFGKKADNLFYIADLILNRDN